MMPLFAVAEAADLAILQNIKTEILNPIISLVFALAFVYFFFGVVKFISQYGNETARKEGKSHMLWGIVGLAIMVSVYGLINLVYATIEALGK